ncbi:MULTISPECIES: flagellar motor stator protein MotA [unclassified Minwuia]|jgi:chemotaxis protein MotA|uniref:flagellar motor stator protein MotA n=1 Tax=unclassified Minwuia TaxID=2618799 RepID=UPI00247979FA|nr:MULTISPECIES: flagellar motor stator protein MotA [unclassified Minwuia]MDF1731055.1 flagellar motor stator protein MotA [Minwuia sp.]
MFFIIGVLVVIGSVLGGYLPHGSFAVLVQPLEVLIICGAAFGGFIISNPKTVIFGVFKSIGKILKGQPYNKAAYVELLTMQYTIYKLAKAKGMLALEAHIEDPEKSSIFSAFPNFMKNHHAVEFVCDYLRLMTMGTENAHEMEALMDEDIETHHHEQHAIASAVTTVGDGLPAFGIVAAVLGVIVTMSSISEPPEVLGGLIGAALVGTFLGILLAYGFVGPMGKNLENYAEAEGKYYQCLKAGMLAYLNGYAPAVSVEFARKTLYSHERPSFSELEEAVENAPKI